VNGAPSCLFCDTSFFYATIDRRDENHSRAIEILQDLEEEPRVLATTWEVVSETLTLLRYRRNHRAAIEFLDHVKPLLQIVPIGDGVRTEAERVFRRFGQDHRLSFCDAVTFVVVTTILGNPPCLSFDEDFRALGLHVIR